MTNQQECGRCVWQDLGKSTVLTEVVGNCVYRREEGGGFLCGHDASKGKRLTQCPHPAITAKIQDGVAAVALEKMARQR